MLLRDYVAALEKLFLSTPFVTSTSLSYEERPPSAGMIKATIVFADGSQLDLREFLVLEPVVQVFKYAYNYRKAGSLIFRYDNANDPAGRNFRTFPEHKHVSTGILEAVKPSVEQVLDEVVSRIEIT